MKFALAGTLFHQVYYLYSSSAFAWVVLEQAWGKYALPLGAYLSNRAYRLLALGAIRVPIRLYAHLSRCNLFPAVVEVPAARSVLVLAPHMDDETIGCGGATLSHITKGSQVEVVFITDGAAGFSKFEYSGLTSQELRDIRKEEGVKACEILGVSKTHYLNLPDGRSQPTDEAVAKLLTIIDQVKPEVIYIPFLTDTHYDHRTTNKIFLTALRRRENISSILCCCYEVWTPIYPNCIVDITAHMDAKMAALGSYESQLKMNNYLTSVRGLNAYRSIANKSKGYAEAFYRTTATDYLALADIG
jgi:LmbE family N-acetylglucosaminyl deacetylase